jgi:hypothetical protein
MAMKYINIFLPKALLKFTKIGIFGLKINPLATLLLVECLLLEVFFSITEVIHIFSTIKSDLLVLTKNSLGHVLGRVFHELIRSP